jgi:2-oxoglutarate dehydrogenase E2 component (dihydrolipoamide succinyltransferase)
MSKEIVVPELGESVIEATVARWLKSEGERIAVGEAVVELETDKVDLEVGADQDGVLAEIRVQEGEDVQVGDVLAVLGEVEGAPGSDGGEGETQPTGETSEAGPTAGEVVSPDEEGRPSDERVTPVARRLAEARGVDLSQITGTGRGGRVTKEDVQEKLDSEGAEGGERPSAPGRSHQARPRESEGDRREKETPAAGAPRPEERLRMSRRRRTIAQRLVEAQRTAAMLTTFNDVDMGAVMDLRRRRKEAFLERHGVKLGIVSFFIKACVGALKQFPRLNAEIQENEILLKGYYDIGVAIGASEGLVVPVLRDVDRMSFAQIESGIKEFAQAAEEGTLSLEDLRGGTFTITNGGIFGSLLSTPILNPPQVGILGLHRIEDRPTVQQGEVTVRPMMYLALSYDHRIVDGREAVQFLVRIKELIEDPESLLLEG